MNVTNVSVSHLVSGSGNPGTASTPSFERRVGDVIIVTVVATRTPVWATNVNDLELGPVFGVTWTRQASSIVFQAPNGSYSRYAVWTGVVTNHTSSGLQVRKTGFTGTCNFTVIVDRVNLNSVAISVVKSQYVEPHQPWGSQPRLSFDLAPLDAPTNLCYMAGMRWNQSGGVGAALVPVGDGVQLTQGNVPGAYSQYLTMHAPVGSPTVPTNHGTGTVSGVAIELQASAAPLPQPIIIVCGL